MSSLYIDTIRGLVEQIPTELVDFSLPREYAHTPTQASSNFITNKEQGDWAEKLIMAAINKNAINHVAVKYGKSDDLIAGDEGFDEFFKDFQEELDTIGKRPDLLIFKKRDFDESLGFDISHCPHHAVSDYVRKAIAGIEVRSSSFLFDKYEEAMTRRTAHYTRVAIDVKHQIEHDYSELLKTEARKKYLDLIGSINEDTVHVVDFKVPGWHSSKELTQVNDLFKKLKSAIKEVQKRDYLSITPKVEDLKVVYKWIETYGVPHYYFQVFFDRVYGISFEQILKIISASENEGSIFSVESDTKNQNKTTIKIKSKTGTEIASKVDEPMHQSVRREAGRGRLLFYVTFKGGTAYLDVDHLKSILNINEDF